MSNFQNKINKQEKGIWRYANFYDKFIEQKNRLVIKDGNARALEIKNVNKMIGIDHLYFKREDENITGSIKDRSLAYQVSLAKQNEKKELVISTSGNAGIAAAAYCQKAGIKLYVFISPETEEEKIAEMQKYNPIIIKSKRAIRLANYLSAKYKIENLRPSVNNSSIEGFKSIAFEIFENLGEIDALFIFATSGSSFVGIGRAYKHLLSIGEIKKMPKLFAVQSGRICSIAEEFENTAKPSPILSQEKSNALIQSNAIINSQAGKLGVKNTRRKKEILELIKSSGGSGIYIDDSEVARAKNILEKNNIYTSLEGCASFAGAVRASKKNKFDKIVCILSGKLRTLTAEIDASKIYKTECFGDVDGIVKLKLK